MIRWSDAALSVFFFHFTSPADGALACSGHFYYRIPYMSKHKLQFTDENPRAEVASLDLVVVFLGGGRKRALEDGVRVEFTFVEFELYYQKGPKTPLRLYRDEELTVTLANSEGSAQKKLKFTATSAHYQPSSAEIEIVEEP